MADKHLVVLKQGAVPRIGIEDQLSVAEFLEHCVGVVRGQHGVIATAGHKSGLADGTQNGVLGIRRGAPSDQRLGLRIGYLRGRYQCPDRPSRACVRFRNARPDDWLADDFVKNSGRRGSGASVWENASSEPPRDVPLPLSARCRRG